MSLPRFGVNILGLLALTACSSTPSEPRFPEFSDFIAIQLQPTDDESILAAQVDLASRITFDDREIDVLYRSPNADDLLAVYLDARTQDPRRVDALEKASSRWPENRLVALQMADHCSYANAEQEYKYCDADAFESLLDIDASNMASFFIAAAHRFSRGRQDEALDYLRLGNSRDRFSLYAAEYFALLVEKATKFGFPRYAANSNALRSAVPVIVFRPLLEMCKGLTLPAQEALLAECVKMGKNVEDHSLTVVEKAFGIAMQIGALEAYGPANRIVDRLDERQRQMTESQAELFTFPIRLHTEMMWQQYHTDIFQIGELSAFDKLIGRLREAAEDAGSP